MLYETAGNRKEMKPSFLLIVSLKAQLSTEKILQAAQWAVADIKGNFMSVNWVLIIVIIHVSNIIANQVCWSVMSARSSQQQEKQRQSDLWNKVLLREGSRERKKRITCHIYLH